MKKIFFVITVMLTNAIYPQSVDSLINIAFENNPLLKSFKAKIEAIQNRSESVSQLPPPTLGVEFNQVPIKSANVWDDAESNSLSLSQMFMLGGKLGAMREAELKGIGVEKANLKTAAIDIVGQIKMNYYNLWMIERKIEIQKKTNDLLKQLINNLNVQLSTNRVSQADILSLTSEIYTNETQILNLQNEKTKYINTINRYLGVRLDTIQTVSELNNNISADEKELEKVLVDENPELNKMNAMVEMNKSMITANRKELVPDLMIQGMIMRMPLGMPLTTKTDLTMLTMGMGEPAKTEYMYSIMASITLPFAPWSSNKYKFKEEELLSSIKGIEYEKEDMQNNMISELKNNVLKLNNAKNLLNLYSNDVIPSYEKSLNAQIISYQTNRTNLTSVIDAFRMLLMQNMNYYMAQADIQMAAAEIEMMVGSSVLNKNFDKE
ncbi:MAG TPA: TolC family protein [Ignavibacteriaceae bacterium]|nr:TolC family protein [Ignavibacteriaceae bacterium]